MAKVKKENKKVTKMKKTIKAVRKAKSASVKGHTVKGAVVNKKDKTISIKSKMTVAKAATVLAEFNKWRRGEGKYAWHEIPSRNKDFIYSSKELGEAIDVTVSCLKSKAGK